MVEEKACYELKCHNYEEVISKKSISKSQLDEILNKYIDSDLA
jgi:hypothetical protein